MGHQETKLSIIQSSKQLFCERGYKATTVRDIAKHALVSSSAIAYHFKSKQGILIHIIEQLKVDIGDDLFDVLDENAKSKEEFSFILKIYINNILIMGIRNWETVKILLTESYELGKIEEVSTFNFSHISKLVYFIKNARKSKIIRQKISEDFLADHIMALVMDQVLHYQSKKDIEGVDLLDKKQRETWVGSVLDILLNGALG